MVSTELILSFVSPATYRICVQGYLKKERSDYLQGMAISNEVDHNQRSVTILTGCLLDQAALLGVLNGLYNYHLPLLSVECLSINPEPEPQRQKAFAQT